MLVGINRVPRVLALTAALLLPAPLLFASPPRSTSEDALARPEFDKELSIDAKGLGIVSAFRILARSLDVPFIIDFEPEASLTVNLTAKNMVSRGILASLASSYGLEYVSAPEGILVRRTGFPSAAKPVKVGAWPVRPGPVFEFELLIRGAAGQTIASPKIWTQLGVVASLKQGLEGVRHEVPVFDRKRNIVEPESKGYFELAFSVTRESADGLDMIVEFIVSKAVSKNSYSEEHVITEPHVGMRETVLAKSADGVEFVLKRWSKAASPQPEPES